MTQPRMQAGRSQDAKPWVQRAQRAILLTGTPATSRPKELYTLVGLGQSVHAHGHERLEAEAAASAAPSLQKSCAEGEWDREPPLLTGA